MVTYEPDLIKQYIRRIALDLVIIPLAFYLAWFVRFDCHVPTEEWGTLTRYVFPIALVYIAINVAFGIYRRLWAYASFRDVIFLTETVGLGTLILVMVNFALTDYYHYRLSTGGLIDCKVQTPTDNHIPCLPASTDRFRSGTGADRWCQ